MAAPDAPCRVFWASPVDPESAARLVRLLDAHERERLTRFHRAADRARYLAAHALTRLVLGDALSTPADRLVFDRTCRCGQQHGKPTLREPGAPGFSFTHSGGFVGVAVAPGAVGLDVEELRPLPDLDGMVRHVFSAAEREAGTVRDEVGFFSVWTRKEAVLKATGDGLSQPMNAITLGRSEVAEWVSDNAPAGPMWVHEMAPAEGYVAATAGFGEVAPVVLEHDGNMLLH